MNILQILKIAVAGHHEVIAWFEHNEKAFAARVVDPPSEREAMNWLMKGQQVTRRALCDEKYRWTLDDGPVFSEWDGRESISIVEMDGSAYPIDRRW